MTVIFDVFRYVIVSKIPNIMMNLRKFIIYLKVILLCASISFCYFRTELHPYFLCRIFNKLFKSIKLSQHKTIMSLVKGGKRMVLHVLQAFFCCTLRNNVKSPSLRF